MRTVYSDYNSSFNKLLDKDGSFTIHQRNVQSLAIEIYKYLHGLSPAILNEVFKVNKTIPYDLRIRNELYARNPKTVRYGTEAVAFFVSNNLVFDTTKYKTLAPNHVSKKALENGDPTAHVVYAKHFCNMLVF